MKRAVLTILIPFAAVLNTGCGNALHANANKALESSYLLDGTNSSYSTSNTNSSDPNYTCPTTPNVLPDYDYWHDGTNRYTACTNNNNQTDIMLHGATAGGNQICVFPAQVIDSQHIFTKPDLTTGLPMSQCIDITSQGVYASFAGVNYNALFIVSGADNAQMQSCLFGGNYYACPRYSFGRFR